jgi:hypothetical protein
LDPGSGMGKNQDPGSGINIPDPQHIFLLYKEIQMGAVAKSFMRKGFLIYEEMRKYLVIYGEAVVINYFATAPFWIFFYMKKILFSFLSVWHR